MSCELAARMSELCSSDKLGYFRPTGTQAACQRLRIVDNLATASHVATRNCLIDDLRAIQHTQVRTHLLAARAVSEVNVWLHHRCHAQSDAGYS
jgi:hypothetical protein